MTKETYIEKTQEITDKINQLCELKKDITKEYIETNMSFNIGDRIVNQNGEFGYVDSFELDFRTNVKPKCLKEKKDGTKSKQYMWISMFDEIKLSPK